MISREDSKVAISSDLLKQKTLRDVLDVVDGSDKKIAELDKALSELILTVIIMNLIKK